MQFNPIHALDILREELSMADAAESDYVLFGSMPMWFNGLRDAVGDIDVFVTRPVYDRLATKSYWIEQLPREDDPPFLELAVPPPIHVFYAWTSRDKHMNVKRNFAEAQVSKDGWRYAPLTEVRKWKVEANRPKDLPDVEAIDRFLGRELIGV